MKKTKTNTILKRVLVSAVALAIVFASTVSTAIFASAQSKPKEFAVRIYDKNLLHIEYMSGGTVKDALKKAEIELSGDDVMNVKEDDVLYDSMTIDIDRVKYITDVDNETIAFDTEYVESDDYAQGYQQVSKQGKNGVSEVRTVYKYVNGERKQVCSKATRTIAQPVNKVVTKGSAAVVPASSLTTTKKSTQSTSSNANNVINGLSYSKVLTGSATAYTANQGALTATGVPAYVGGVAVNPDIIPYGSKLYIVADGYTYGYATAVDTGGALMSGTALVDLYMATYDECINFGRRNVTVYVLD